MLSACELIPISKDPDSIRKILNDKDRVFLVNSGSFQSSK